MRPADQGHQLATPGVQVLAFDLAVIFLLLTFGIKSSSSMTSLTAILVVRSAADYFRDYLVSRTNLAHNHTSHHVGLNRPSDDRLANDAFGGLSGRNDHGRCLCLLFGLVAVGVVLVGFPGFVTQPLTQNFRWSIYYFILPKLYIFK